MYHIMLSTNVKKYTHSFIFFLCLFTAPFWVYPYLKEASKNKNDVPQNQDTSEIYLQFIQKCPIVCNLKTEKTSYIKGLGLF